MASNAIRKLIRKIHNHYFRNSSDYIAQLRDAGMAIGDDVTVHFPDRTFIDPTAPHLITIGDHVNITGPATILTHDFSWSVIKTLTGEILGNQQAVTIGNNVFIGWGATILAGTTIEDNTIIGAHAVVGGRITGNSVWGGVPAKRICSLEHYKEKRDATQEIEAKDFVRRFRERFGRDPKEEEVYEYFYLWTSPDSLNEVYERQLHVMGSYDLAVSKLGHGPYRDFGEFLRDC